jgi:hypothetical protein
MTASRLGHPWHGRSRPAALVAVAAAAALVTAFMVPGAAASATTKAAPAVASSAGLPYQDAGLPVTQRVADLLAPG